MENDTNLFGLNLDTFITTQLRETAKWARFLAIVGLISLGVIVIYSLVVILSANSVPNEYRDFENPAYSTGYYIGTAIGLLLVVVIYFFPCFYMLRFSNKMFAALESGDNTILMESFRNLKITFRYVGILTIICIVLFAIGLLSNLG